MRVIYKAGLSDKEINSLVDFLTHGITNSLIGMALPRCFRSIVYHEVRKFLLVNNLCTDILKKELEKLE